MTINKKNRLGTAMVSIAATSTLIVVTGFLGQSALAATPTQSPMPSNMVMPQTPAKSTAAPAVAKSKSPTPVTKPVSTTKVATKPTPSVNYLLIAGKKFASLKATLGLSTLARAKKPQVTIGSFTADKVGTFAFSYKSTIAKSSTIFVTVKGKSPVLFSGKLLQLAKVGTIARPFVPPTPTAPLIPVPVPTTTPTPVATPTATPSPAATPGVALVPSLGTLTPTKDGYIVQIANFDSAFTWNAKDLAGGTVFISSTGQITVTKLAASTKTSITITTNRNDYPSGTFTSADITVLAADATFTPPPSFGGGGGGTGGGGVITITLKAPSITLSVSAISVNQQEVIPAYIITNKGDAATSYSLSPAAPAGTTFNTSTGILSGAPTNAQANTAYTITATNASGSSTAQFTLTVLAGINQQIHYVQPIHMRVGGLDQVLQAAASSALPVTFTVNSASTAVCSLVAIAPWVEVHALTAGTCTIDANQPGAAPYFAAPQVEFAFTVIAANSTSSIVVIDPNGGTTLAGSADRTSQVVPSGGAVSLPALTNGTMALTWALGDINGGAITSPYTPNGDVTIVAKWA
jgi:hypothetical protein